MISCVSLFQHSFNTIGNLFATTLIASLVSRCSFSPLNNHKNRPCMLFGPLSEPLKAKLIGLLLFRHEDPSRVCVKYEVALPARQSYHATRAWRHF